MKWYEDELNSILSGCNFEGWDGYDATPVTQRSIDVALEFSKLIPSGCEPEICPDRDGEISFDWFLPNSVFSASIGESKLICWAGHVDDFSFHGGEIFNGVSLPGGFIELIEEFCKQRKANDKPLA